MAAFLKAVLLGEGIKSSLLFIRSGACHYLDSWGRASLLEAALNRPLTVARLPDYRRCDTCVPSGV